MMFYVQNTNYICKKLIKFYSHGRNPLKLDYLGFCTYIKAEGKIDPSVLEDELRRRKGIKQKEYDLATSARGHYPEELGVRAAWRGKNYWVG